MKTKKTEYMLFGGEPNHTGLYINRIKALSDMGMDVSLILKCIISYTDIYSYLYKKNDIKIGPSTVFKITKQIPGVLITIPYITRISFVGKIIFTIAASIVFKRISSRCDQLIIHCMNSAEYVIFIKKLLRLNNIKIISEVEGDIISEMEYVIDLEHNKYSTAKKQLILDRAYKTQKKIVESSDILLCPTENMRSLIRDRFSISAFKKTNVFPFFASSSLFYYDQHARELMRKKLGLTGRFVVVYCGNLRDSWQMPSMLAKVFKIINNLTDNAFFYIITPRSNELFMRPFLKDVHNSNYTFMEIEHSEISAYLCAADCALLIREPHLMNKVVAPAKFAEYALTGLPIIMTTGIGYYPEMMRDNDNALILSDLESDVAIKSQLEKYVIQKIPKLNRTEFADWASVRFSLEQQIPKLINAYAHAAEMTVDNSLSTM